MEHLFAPPTETWHPISPNWRTLSRLTTALVPVVFTVPALLVGLLSGLWWISVAIWALGFLIAAIRWGLIGRRYRAWGYALRADDLYITHGVLFRTLIAVPYGRMQAIEVNSGPLERAFHLASVQLITASPASNATIVGLPPDEAARLRDQLSELGESQASGL